MAFLNRLVELTLPEYRARHLLVAKLRLIAFAGFWAGYLFFLHGVIRETLVIPLIVLACFFLAAFAHYQVLHERSLFGALAVELFSDLTAISAIVYLTGGVDSDYYTLFFIYIFTAGILYNHRLAAVIALCVSLWYALLLWFLEFPFVPPLRGAAASPLVQTPSAWVRWGIVTFFLAVAVYAIRLASELTSRRERELESRNRELAALFRMSSTIRSMLSLKEVIEQVLELAMELPGVQA